MDFEPVFFLVACLPILSEQENLADMLKPADTPL